jgi:hypothetical protein
LAGLGGGRYHFAADPGSIPSIFTEETSLATRAYLVEHPFTPRRAQTTSSILSGIDATPQLLGYVATTAKDVAETALVSDLGDLPGSIRQYGLGRSARSPPMRPALGRGLVGLGAVPDFWSQVLNSVIQKTIFSRGALDLRVGAPKR